ncbi:MAG: glycosyltransferase [Desulfosudaceae bacterium]
MNKDDTCRTDMHVHSRYSHRPSSWILKKIGCSESYTDPAYLYRSLKNRGMTMVTITDHNTINGCLEISHLPDTFLSEEVTAYFPEDNCKIHVLVYNITEAQHADISRVRENIYELQDFLEAQAIAHAVAHPLFSVNGRLTVRHFQKLLLLFKWFELNGARDFLQNAILRRIVFRLTPEKIETLANRHGITPRGEQPWEKRLISGSDDHSSLYLGCSWTAVPGVVSVPAFLNGIGRGRATIRTRDSGPLTLAHNIYSIMYQFYNETFQLNRWIDDADLSSFLSESLLPKDYVQGPCTAAGQRSRPFPAAEFSAASAANPFLENARLAIAADPDPAEANRHQDDSGQEQAAGWFHFVNRLFEKALRQFADDVLSRLTRADLFYLFTTMGSSASLYMMLSPYFIAHSLFTRDRLFAEECLHVINRRPLDFGGQNRHIAMFTDTFNEINGVATAIRTQVEAARLTKKSLTLITCDPDQSPREKVAVFAPIGQFDLPEYPELKIYYPPVLKILDHCYQARYTHIHAETPGAMGLTALAVARILNLPFNGTYHTSLPQTVGSLTGDGQTEKMFWKYLIWFYGQMERIYVPSAMTSRELIAKGLPEDKIIVHPWGVDIENFHPGKRNGFFAERYRIPESMLKLIYVGRVSREKNLQVFEEMMRQIHHVRKDVCLIVVGEGPYLEDLRTALAGLPVIFTGYLTGEDLARAYASGDIFLFPSTIDTMGNVVIEAQASGLPVIVTDQGGPQENLIDRQTGYVVPADKFLPQNFAQAVLRLCHQPEQLAAMRRNARSYTRQRSFENSFRQFWDNYHLPH